MKLTQQMEWLAFEPAFGQHYAEEGRPSGPMRVMVGLHYLKYVFNESDESVVAKAATMSMDIAEERGDEAMVTLLRG